MVQYITRFVKYMVYYAVFLTLLLVLFFYTSDHDEITHFWELIHPSNYWQVALFLLVFCAIYPFIGFTERKVYLNHPFSQDRDALIEPVIRANYQITSDHDQKITLRPKSAFTRFMRLYEDKIVLDYADNPITINGMRRDVYRFARSMEYVVRQE